MITDSPLNLSTEYPNTTITVEIYEDLMIECSESITFDLAFHGASVPRLRFGHSEVTVEIRDNEESKL